MVTSASQLRVFTSQTTDGRPEPASKDPAGFRVSGLGLRLSASGCMMVWQGLGVLKSAALVRDGESLRWMYLIASRPRDA